MLRFYQGLSYKELAQMPASAFNSLWKSIDVLEAQEHIEKVRVESYPSLTKKAKTERDNKLLKAAYPKEIYKREAKDVSFLVKKLGGK